jgi:membrane-associated phospholipid phosphatase
MAVLTKEPTDAPSPVEPPENRVLLIVLAVAVAVFVTVTLLVHWQLTTGFDEAVVKQVGATRGSLAAHAARSLTSLGDTIPLLTILIVAGVLAPVRWGGGWRLLALPCVSAALGYAASSGIKLAVGRSRPPESGWVGTAHGYAFPSGHATSATAGYLVLAVLVAGLMPTARRRMAVFSAGIAVALLVGASRVVLAVHWPTDVIAGWALGAAVAAATLAVTRMKPAESRHWVPPPEEAPR